MPEFDYLWKDGPRMAQSGNIRFGTDAVLLGNFVNIGGARRGIDLGCASGILMLLLLARSSRITMTGIEIDAEAADLADQNLRLNALESRGSVVNGDLRACRSIFPSGSFDVIVSNPPYFRSNAGGVSPDGRRASAREETTCTLENVCAAAEYLCRWGGSVNFVYRPERLPELFSAMTAHGIEPKRLRLVAHNVSAVPSLVLVEGRRGGNPGLAVEPILIIKGADGEDSEEIKRIYRRS